MGRYITFIMQLCVNKICRQRVTARKFNGTIDMHRIKRDAGMCKYLRGSMCRCVHV